MSKKVLHSMNFYTYECVPRGGLQVCVLVGNVCFPHFLYVVFLLVVGRVLFSLFQRIVWQRNCDPLHITRLCSIRCSPHIQLSSRRCTGNNGGTAISTSVLLFHCHDKTPWPRYRGKHFIWGSQFPRVSTWLPWWEDAGTEAESSHP